MSLNSTDPRQIRKFGFISVIFFGCLCAVGLWKGKPVPTYLFGFLSVLGIGFILMPGRLRPVYARWLTMAHFLGTISTALVLTLAYYLVITPSALIKRLFGGRPLPVKPDRKASSYWVTRQEPAQPRKRFLKRY